VKSVAFIIHIFCLFLSERLRHRVGLAMCIFETVCRLSQ